TSWRTASNPSSIVSTLFKVKYHYSKTLWDVCNPNRDSWCWRSILKGKDIIRSSLKWRIGQGDK
ncbi:hypothetical protein MKX03_011894, partial [Papaver bracteatum]